MNFENYNFYTRLYLSAAQLIVKIKQSNQKYQILLILMGYRTRRQNKFIKILSLPDISPKAFLPLLKLA
jgi:hypothetical protein